MKRCGFCSKRIFPWQNPKNYLGVGHEKCAMKHASRAMFYYLLREERDPIFESQNYFSEVSKETQV